MGRIHDQPGDNITRIRVLQAFGGGLAGGVMRSCTHPFDVLKIRLQMQAKHHSIAKYRGIMHGLRTVYVEEGVRGLTLGHNTSQVMSIIHGLVQFWAYEQLSAMSQNVSYLRDHTFLKDFLCGGLSGCWACLAAYPLDIVRAQAMTGSGRTRLTTLQGVRRVYTMDGWKGLSRGLPFALMETFPLMGFKFLFYKYLNTLTQSRQQQRKMDCSNVSGGFMFVNGALAGGTAKMVVYPVDLLTKRIQLQTFNLEPDTSHQRPDCPTVRRCIANTFQNEGLRGFYKGMSPTLVKAVVANAIYFTVYDLFSKHFIMPLLEKGQGNHGS